MHKAIALCLALAGPVQACETALLLAVDVSGSIDPEEYHLQMNGLADALADPEIVTVLVKDKVALSLMHWSGNGYQQVSLGWHSMTTQPSVARFAAFVRRVERPRHYSDTAIGDAIFFSLEHLQSKTDCARHVIDISGDGEENAGLTLAAARKAATDARVTINAIAIEEVPDLHPLTGYFRRWVATPDGFVITANGVADYPRAIRIKLARELAKPTS